MSDKKESGIKSAYELAMERLAKKGEKPVAITEKQKRDIASIDQQTRAKIAEVEIMMESNLASARASGDVEKLKLLEESKAREIGALKARGEEEKERVRRGT